jgi:hypothetical protein
MLEHCMYAGATLARVGLDFRAALLPMFESRILALFTQVPPPAADTGRNPEHVCGRYTRVCSTITILSASSRGQLGPAG